MEWRRKKKGTLRLFAGVLVLLLAKAPKTVRRPPPPHTHTHTLPITALPPPRPHTHTHTPHPICTLTVAVMSQTWMLQRTQQIQTELSTLESHQNTTVNADILCPAVCNHDAANKAGLRGKIIIIICHELSFYCFSLVKSEPALPLRPARGAQVRSQ